MQSSGDQWLKETDNLMQPTATDASSKPHARLLDIPLPQLSALYSSAKFVRCTADGKDATSVSARLDTCGHFLRVSSEEGECAVDIRKLRVSWT